jgi:multiple sugar transport system ATP-binding protein
MAEIRFEKVTKWFGDIEVVKDLSLTIQDGEFFTFVGPSGCGKSTLLNLIAGLDGVTSGSILFDNKPVNDLPPKDRDVAMVFQSYALYPHMSVYENIAFPLRMKKAGRETVDREVRRVGDILGLAGLLERKPKELSGGQRQRVALARAMVRRPRVFLMDEPLSNLDARLRLETRAELKKLHRDLGITTLYVTHDQSEAMGLSDRIAVLHEGRVRQVGTPGEIYAKPADVFVAGFMGGPPMNFVPCAPVSSKPPAFDCLGRMVFPSVSLLPKAGKFIAGIRPEDISVSAKQSEGSVEVVVSVIEPVGPYNWVDSLWGGVGIKGMAQLDEVMEPGQAAYMHFFDEKVILFDQESGRRL